MTKYCGGCRQYKELSEFGCCKSAPDLHQYQCKPCMVFMSKRWADKNRDRRNAATRRCRKNNPWYQTFTRISSRCKNPKHLTYGHYHKLGIEIRITREELKKLWYRDGAETMKRPSIDRIDPLGHYEFANCRYIELSENIKRATKRGKGRPNEETHSRASHSSP